MKANTKANRGFDGKGGLRGAIDWLFAGIDDEDKRNAAFAHSFGVPARTVRNTLANERDGKSLTGWTLGFLAALRYFDRRAMQTGGERVAVEASDGND